MGKDIRTYVIAAVVGLMAFMAKELWDNTQAKAALPSEIKALPERVTRTEDGVTAVKSDIKRVEGEVVKIESMLRDGLEKIAAQNHDLMKEQKTELKQTMDKWLEDTDTKIFRATNIIRQLQVDNATGRAESDGDVRTLSNRLEHHRHGAGGKVE